MIGTGSPRPLLAAVFAAGLVAGCLDAGPRPVGRHLVTTRAEGQVLFVPGAVGQPARIVLTHSQNVGGVFGFNTQQLSTVDDPGPGGGATPPRVLVDHVGQMFLSCFWSTCTPIVDARGRLYVDRQSFMSLPDTPGATLESDELALIDPATGTQQSFGPTELVLISPDRARVVIEPLGPMTVLPPFVRELDGSTIPLPDGASALNFVGNDFYFATDDQRLWRLAASSGTPEVVATGVSFYQTFPTARGPLMLITRVEEPAPMALSAKQTQSIFDTSSLTETQLPFASYLAPSPSGRYLAAQSVTPFDPTPSPAPNAAPGVTLTIYDRDTGEQTTADEPGSLISSVVWRPRHDEVWFVLNLLEGDLDHAWRWLPGGTPRDAGHGASPSFISPFGPSSPQRLATTGQPAFTPDGRFRLIAGNLDTERAPVYLQSADDDAAAPQLLNPEGVALANLWPLVDGRLLVEDWITDQRRNDIYLVDGAAATSRALASSGNVVATGRDRFLALLHWVAAGGSGDLTLIDYASGAQTLVAQNVSAVAVDAAADAPDFLAPGTRVAYLVHNRITSPYDGLWVIDLP